MKKIYVECPEFIKYTKLNERSMENFKKTIFREFELVKNGKELKINFSKIAKNINNKKFNKWIFLKTEEEVKKWEEVKKYAKDFGISGTSFILFLVYDEILKEL